jgi:nucleoid DNA-binding protein
LPSVTYALIARHSIRSFQLVFPSLPAILQAGMRKKDFVLRLAQDASVSPAEAADEIDAVVHEILKKVRRGKQASLPGLGTFVPGQNPKFRFTEKNAKSESSKRKK